VQAAASLTSPAVCLQWDISGEWQYQASLGGLGTFSFQQAGESGALTGSWHNVAGGGSGTLYGNISGASVEFHPTEFETYTGTVAPDGTKMAGTFTYYDKFGTWEATGSADCLREPPPPVLGTANITVRWGNHLYRLVIQMPAAKISAMASAQATPAGLPVITFLGDTQLDVEIIYTGTDLPQTLTVRDRVNGQDVVIGTLQLVDIFNDGRVRYSGRVTVRPRGTIAPGQRQIHDIIVIDPWSNEVWAARIVMQLIDPSGYIRDAVTQERIEGAIASCYQKVGGQWVLWNAEQFAQTNPQPSNFEGYYGWDVEQGEYKVKVSKACYADAESAALTVPPPRTDVHFNLTPLGCSAVEIGDVWTTNASSIPVLDFIPGQEVATHVQVANDESSDSTIEIRWATTDPGGQPVPALTGSNTYILPENSSIDIKVGGQLPADAEAGTYTQTTQTTHNQQTSMLVSQFNVLPSPGLFLPLILHTFGEANGPTPTLTPTPTEPPPTVTPTPTQPAVSGIYGRVTDNGQAAAGVELLLRFYDGYSWSTAKTTTTDGDGRYRFTHVGALGSGQKYYVRYANDGDNTRVDFWYGPDITSYTNGENVQGGDFDIEDIELLSPSPGATERLPIMFQWRRRGNSGESYRLYIFDPDSDDRWRTNSLGDVDGVTLGELPEGAQYGKEYGWYMRVYQGEDSYGKSYYYSTVTFSASATTQETVGASVTWTPINELRPNHALSHESIK